VGVTVRPGGLRAGGWCGCVGTRRRGGPGRASRRLVLASRKGWLRNDPAPRTTCGSDRPCSGVPSRRGCLRDAWCAPNGGGAASRSRPLRFCACCCAAAAGGNLWVGYFPQPRLPRVKSSDVPTGCPIKTISFTVAREQKLGQGPRPTGTWCRSHQPTRRRVVRHRGSCLPAPAWYANQSARPGLPT